MNDKLFIPDKIKVGYQHRLDTYTEKLAYVIYYDTKGKLCKETSWRGWIHDTEVFGSKHGGDHFWKPQPNDFERFKKDDSYILYPAIPPTDFENIPTEGFVLNKKAGGYSTGWNHRQMKCRVFDPRGFEFEIAIDNLLFILQVTNSYKGKGLEGQFVYAWSGKDIVLLPCESEDFVNSREFTDMKSLKVSAKSLVEGYTYLHKNMDSMVFMGKQDFVTWPAWKKTYNVNKEYVFYDIKNNNFLAVKPTNIAKVIDESIHIDYAEIVEKMQCCELIKCFDVIIEDAGIEFKKTYDKNYYESNSHQEITRDVYLKSGQNIYTKVSIFAYFQPDYNNMDYWQRQSRQPRPATEEECKMKHSTPVNHYKVSFGTRYKIIGNEIQEIKYEDQHHNKLFSISEVENSEYKIIKLKFFNDTTKNI